MPIKYGSLIQFDPVESIIKLQQANAEEAARNLVRTYVISDQMADRLTQLVIPQLQFETPADNKCLLFVGNYGTGKSHLMSVVTAIAEHGHLVSELRHPRVAAKAGEVAGKFKVIRTEIGHTTMNLREFLVDELEQGLEAMGVHYTFPSTSQRGNHIASFQEMMDAFHQQYPDHGLLLAVDELLDYLRNRRGQHLIGDFQFLREVGEACKYLRFRFMAGAQEAIFDSSTFENVADDLRRVKDRFEQVLLVKGDLKYVAAERLLKKTPAQENQVRSHLIRFTKFYSDMNERMDEFVRLFPVHPDYIDTFEELRVVEQRQVLKALSGALRDHLEKDVPDNAPGLLTYDQYWTTIASDASLRNKPDIAAVLERVQVLEQRIRLSAPPHVRDMALKIVDALAIHRLTTGDLKLKIGPTAQELRDTLCLYDPEVGELGGDPAEDLLTHVESVMAEIIRTVNGQFIGHAEASGQYYLDLAKDIDYDAQIDRRARVVGDDKLDEAYYNVLLDLLELPATRYQNTHLAWQYELPWLERRAPRDGYLFLGTPHERSTAQPERDFYLYFIQPWDEPTPLFEDQHKRDEIFFRLTEADDAFRTLVRRCAAAGELASTASGAHQEVYKEKQRTYRGLMGKWLSPRLTTAIAVTYRGVSKPLGDWLKGVKPVAGFYSDTPRDLVEGVAATCFAAYFKELAPDYPVFPVRITKNNREEAIRNALKWIAGSKTTLGAQVLDGLELLDGDQLNPEQSKYANYIRQRLADQPAGKVLNRDELFEDGYLAPTAFRLEPDFTLVVLISLIYSGHIVLNTSGKRYEVSDLPLLASTSVTELVGGWTHVQLPQDWNLPAIKTLFELLGLAPGLALDLTKGGQAAEKAIQDFHTRRLQLVEQLVLALNDVKNGLPLWGLALLNETELGNVRALLTGCKEFLEKLQSYTVPARFKGDKVKEPEVAAQQPALQKLKELRELIQLATDLGPGISYLGAAMHVLPADHNWAQLVQTERSAIMAMLLNPVERHNPGFRRQVMLRLTDLKKRYFEAYADLHATHRLDMAGEDRKTKLERDQVLTQLGALSAIPIVVPDLPSFYKRLGSLQSCHELTEKALEASPICKCNFRPSPLLEHEAAKVVLSELEDHLEHMQVHAVQSLRSLFTDPTLEQSKVLKAAEHAMIEAFRDSDQLPSPVTTEFVQMVQRVLDGLTPVTVSGEQLRGALLKGGSPATKEELLNRFKEYLDELSQNKDTGKIRFVLE